MDTANRAATTSRAAEEKSMTQTVSHFTFGFSNSALRMPYAIAVLSCGHGTGCEVKGTRYACGGCGIEARPCEKCACGYSGGFRILEIADPHKPEFRITQIGDVIECKQCEAEAEQAEWLRALDASMVHHTRIRFGNLCLYALDRTSPSNFMLIRSVAATAANEAILASKRVCQLSPTEAA